MKTGQRTAHPALAVASASELAARGSRSALPAVAAGDVAEAAARRRDRTGVPVAAGRAAETASDSQVVETLVPFVAPRIAAVAPTTVVALVSAAASVSADPK